MFWPWLAAFAFTAAIEAPVYRWALHREARQSQAPKRRAPQRGVSPEPSAQEGQAGQGTSQGTRQGTSQGTHHPWLWAAGLSLPTHPIVWFIFPNRWPGGWLDQTLAAEAFAVATEAALLTHLGVRTSLAWALLANTLSTTLGLLARAQWGWP